MSSFFKGLKDAVEEVAPVVAGVGTGLATYAAALPEVGPIFALEAGTAAGGGAYKGTKKFIEDVDPEQPATTPQPQPVPTPQPRVAPSSLSDTKPPRTVEPMLQKPAPRHPLDSVSYSAKVEPKLNQRVGDAMGIDEPKTMPLKKPGTTKKAIKAIKAAEFSDPPTTTGPYKLDTYESNSKQRIYSSPANVIVHHMTTPLRVIDSQRYEEAERSVMRIKKLPWYKGRRVINTGSGQAFDLASYAASRTNTLLL